MCTYSWPNTAKCQLLTETASASNSRKSCGVCFSLNCYGLDKTLLKIVMVSIMAGCNCLVCLG